MCAGTYLFGAAQVELGRSEYVGQRAEPMEQHGGELYYYDEREEEHEHQTNGLQMQVLFADYDLCVYINVCFYNTVICARRTSSISGTLRLTSDVSATVVMFVLTPIGQSKCSLSLFN